MPLRNDPFKIDIFERVIFHHDGEPFFSGTHGRPFGNGPGFEDPSDLQPEIVMEMG
jgi:hypothetical protein